MNKGERNAVTRKKWLQRVRRIWGHTKQLPFAHCYKNQTTPCSCMVCRKPKYDRAKEKRINNEEGD